MLQHLPGYSYGEDLFQYIYNRHPVLGLVWRHPLHPVGTKIRVVCLIGSVCFGLAMSNLIYFAFWFSDMDFNKNYADMVTQKISFRDNFDSEMSAATSAFSNGNLALWTVGSGLHALFDNSLWSTAVCNCKRQRGGIMEQLEAYKRMGEMSVSLYVTGVAIIALLTVGFRLSFHLDEDGDEDSIEAATETFANYEFMISYSLEVFISFFFFYPLVGFVMFAGFLRCIHEATFGGRRYEMKSRQHDERRFDRMEKRKLVLHCSDDSVNLGRQSVSISTNMSEVPLSNFTYNAKFTDPQTLNYNDDTPFYDNQSMAGGYGDQLVEGGAPHRPPGQVLDFPNAIMEDKSYIGADDNWNVLGRDYRRPSGSGTRSTFRDDATENSNMDSLSAMDIAESFLKLLVGDHGSMDRSSSEGSRTDEPDHRSSSAHSRSGDNRNTDRQETRRSLGSKNRLKKSCSQRSLRSERRSQAEWSESSSESSLSIKDCFDELSTTKKVKSRLEKTRSSVTSGTKHASAKGDDSSSGRSSSECRKLSRGTKPKSGTDEDKSKGYPGNYSGTKNTLAKGVDSSSGSSSSERSRRSTATTPKSGTDHDKSEEFLAVKSGSDHSSAKGDDSSHDSSASVNSKLSTATKPKSRTYKDKSEANLASSDGSSAKGDDASSDSSSFERNGAKVSTSPIKTNPKEPLVSNLVQKTHQRKEMIRLMKVVLQKAAEHCQARKLQSSPWRSERNVERSQSSLETLTEIPIWTTQHPPLQRTKA
jgi:hypothetical protein